MSRILIPFVLAIAACHSSPTTESPAKPPTETGSNHTPPPPAGSNNPTPPAPADAVACESDKDCNSHACGPCNAGDVLTKQDVSIKCLRNPCPQSTVSCKNKVCTVN